MVETYRAYRYGLPRDSILSELHRERIRRFGAVTQVSYRGMPANWHPVSGSCSTQMALAHPSVAHVNGPLTPPNGRGSLKISEANTDTMIGIAGIPSGTLLSKVTAFDAGVFRPKTGGLVPTLTLAATAGGTHYLLVGPSFAAGSWADLNAATIKLGWVIMTSSGPESGGTGTLSQFVQQYPDATIDGLLIAPGSTCGSGAFYIDGVHYTIGAANVKVNFEAPLTTTLTNVTHPTSTPAGRRTPISARLKQGAKQLAGQSVQLWSRAKGAAQFKLLRTVKTNATGLAATTVAPTRTTAYQWRYTGVGSYASSRGVAATILVK